MKRKRHYRIALFFGGRSPEHEVSLLSARNVIHALQEGGHTVLPVGIQKDGRWKLYDTAHAIFTHPDDPKKIALSDGGRDVVLLPFYAPKGLYLLEPPNTFLPVDVCFPLIHGTQGEDGTLQGLLEMTNLPYVGATVLGMAVTLDKVVMKERFAHHRLATPRFISFTLADQRRNAISYSEITRTLGTPIFVKPASTGSSIGIHKVRTPDEFSAALEDAFRYDTKLLCEEAIPGREIECSVLGNLEPEASVAGEIIPRHEFYSYEAKYLDPNGADLVVPAALSSAQMTEVQELAKKAYVVCNMSGMGRVDFFIRRSDNRILLNEINGIPGFTNISMYPRLWAASGLSYGDLLERLIELAFERHALQAQVTKHYLSLKR